MPILIICRLRLITLTIFNSYSRDYDNYNDTIFILKNCSNQTPLQTMLCDIRRLVTVSINSLVFKTKKNACLAHLAVPWPA